jgi:Thiol-disulfide isomerase and thioredoxins
MTTLRRFAVLVTLLALVGCGGSEKEAGSAATDRSSQTPEQGSAQRTDAEAPALETVTHEDAMAVLRQSDARLTVVNFWATWCVPCVEEFPAFVKLDQTLDHRGVNVMFISTDFPNEKQKVVNFLVEHDVTGTSYLKTGNSTEFVNGFSEDWSGAVPATFIYDDEGTLLDFWEGKASFEELKQRVTNHLEETESTA